LISDAALGKRASLGSIQTALHEVRLAEEQMYDGLKLMQCSGVIFGRDLKRLETKILSRYVQEKAKRIKAGVIFVFEELNAALKAIDRPSELVVRTRLQIVDASVKGLPTVVVLATDVSAPARAAILAAQAPIL